MITGVIAAALVQLPPERPVSVNCLAGMDKCVQERWPRSPVTLQFRDGRDTLDRANRRLLREFAAQRTDFAWWHPSICVPTTDERSGAREKYLRNALTEAGYREIGRLPRTTGCLMPGGRTLRGQIVYRIDLGPPPGY